MFRNIRRYIFNRGLDENEISYKKAVDLQKKGAVLIDVRSPRRI